MSSELNKLSEEIKNKLDSFYNKGGKYTVRMSNNNIIISGESNTLSDTYKYIVPGEITLSLEGAKSFLETLNKVININNYLRIIGESSISFKVTEGRNIVYEKDGKVLSDHDIFLLHQKLEMKSEINNDTINALQQNMIKARSLYARYVDLFPKVQNQHNFFESYNKLISTFNGKKEAISKAKEYYLASQRAALRTIEPQRDFDIASDEDIIDTIVKGEDVTFNGIVPLEDKPSYILNFKKDIVKVNHLIEVLEIELKKLEEYNEKACVILKDISSKNIFSIKPIEIFPEYNCVEPSKIIADEKEKNINLRIEDDSIPKKNTNNQEYPWLQNVDEQQRKSINTDEKTALMLYKSFMYHLFNNIISYVRDNNKSINEIYNDEYVESLLIEEYDKYKIRLREAQKDISNENAGSKTVVDDLFPIDRIVEYKEFCKIVLENVALLEPAMQKIKLEQPLTVYRCVYKPIGSSLYDGNLGNALLSTSTSTAFISDFIEQRNPDIKFKSEKVIYKIELPVGSPIIAFTDDLFLKGGSKEAKFRDTQKEILLDSELYDFEYVDADFNRLADGTYLHSVRLKAIPKLEQTKNL